MKYKILRVILKTSKHLKQKQTLELLPTTKKTKMIIMNYKILSYQSKRSYKKPQTKDLHTEIQNVLQ